MEQGKSFKVSENVDFPVIASMKDGKIHLKKYVVSDGKTAGEKQKEKIKPNIKKGRKFN